MKSAKVLNMLLAEAPQRAALPAYPQVSQFEQLDRRMTTAMAASGELKVAMQSREIARLSAAVESANRLVHSGEIATLQGELTRALVPATVEEIGARIAVLIKSIPNPGKEDLETYARLLTEDVGAQSPTRLGLEIACRRLRRTAEWLPKISQVLAALEKSEAAIGHAPESIEKLPALIAEAQQGLDTERRWRARREEAASTASGPRADDDTRARLQGLADELRAKHGRPAPAARRGPSEPVPIADAVAAALAGARGASDSAGLTAKEAMAKHRAQQVAVPDPGEGEAESGKPREAVAAYGPWREAVEARDRGDTAALTKLLEADARAALAAMGIHKPRTHR